jgi:hypothetical protein
MSTTHQDKSGGKPRQRSRKADQRREKPEQLRSPEPARPQDDQIDPMIASTEAFTTGEVAPADVPLVGEVLPPVASSTSATAPAANYPIIIQTIARAYGDYTKRSFEEGMSFVEKLMGLRSFDKAIEVHTEFARQAHANFFAESGRMCELYSELAKQIFRPWERFAAQMTRARRQIS